MYQTLQLEQLLWHQLCERQCIGPRRIKKSSTSQMKVGAKYHHPKKDREKAPPPKRREDGKRRHSNRGGAEGTAIPKDEEKEAPPKGGGGKAPHPQGESGKAPLARMLLNCYACDQETVEWQDGEARITSHRETCTMLQTKHTAWQQRQKRTVRKQITHLLTCLKPAWTWPWVINPVP